MAILAEQVDGRRHVRLRLRDATVEKLKDWQHEAYKALRREPTYNELVEAAIARCASISGRDLVASAHPSELDGEDEDLM
ncbi:MAG: hypothetical protein ACREQ5_19555 [Candidatus Dormibacteria bacterium]